MKPSGTKRGRPLAHCMERDGKFMPDSKLSLYFPKFLVCVFVVIPLLCVLIPITIIYQISRSLFARLLSLFGIGKKTLPQSDQSELAKNENPKGKDLTLLEALTTTEPSEIVPHQSRPYDIILLGATGFTGKMAARYMFKNYAHDLKVGIGGRREGALREVRDSILKEMSGDKDARGKQPQLNPEDIGLFVVDTLSESSLKAVVSQTKVVLTTVGPFDKYGNVVVKVCAELGTHYCDITGETDWVRKNIVLYEDVAARSGAKIVSFAGHDCVPWDLCFDAVGTQLKEKGEELKEVRFYDEIRSSPSGGTLDTIYHSLQDRVKVQSNLKFDPLLLLPSSPVAGPSRESEYKTTAKNAKFLSYSAERGAWVGPFVMAMVMGNCVRRTNALKKFGKKVIYNEQVVFPNFFAGVIYMVGMVFFAVSLFFPPLGYLMRTFVLPSPGQGPSERDMDRGFLRIEGHGVGTKGSKVTVAIYYPTDPGYRDTARMLVEAGVTLVKSAKALPQRGGVMTPGAGLGHHLLSRLTATGCEFYLD